MEQYALLGEEEEQRFARRWREFGDRRALDALVRSHLKLAAKVARGYKGYGLPIADVVAEANVGLVVAATRFEPDHGARFSTYARWWIKASIHDYILRSWSLVKIGTTAAQKKLFFRLRSEARKLPANPLTLTPEAAGTIAKNLDVTVQDVVEMDARLRGDMSLNRPINNNDGGTVEWEAMLVDESPDAEELLADHDETARKAGALSAALEVLTQRERQIFEARRLTENPPTLAELADRLSISSERVRQIETRAFQKVKRATLNYLKPSRLELDHATDVDDTDARYSEAELV
jgi:RNA polymerase sigma-32 factor